MANPWFRLYHEFDSDPKVQSMSEAMQRRLVMLFCSRCRGETLHETERAFHWRISEDELAKTKALFTEKGFIEGDWELVNWNRRQFLSDSSTDRVRRYRQGKKQDETLHVTERNVTVTPPDTETDTETEQKQKKHKASLTLPEWLAPDLWEAFLDHRRRLRKPLTPKAASLNLAKLVGFHEQGYDGKAIVEEAIARGWQSFFVGEQTPKRPGMRTAPPARNFLPPPTFEGVTQ